MLKNLRLVEDWHAVLTQAWSVRFAALGTVVLALGSFCRSIDVPGYENLIALGSLVCDIVGPGLAALAVPARVVDQGLAKPKPSDADQLGIGS